MRGFPVLSVFACLCALAPAAAEAAGPQPGTPEYIQRDNQNMADAYGRQTAPDGQLSPDYLGAMPGSVSEGLDQSLRQTQYPTRPIVDPGQWFPGWNGAAFVAKKFLIWALPVNVSVPMLNVASGAQSVIIFATSFVDAALCHVFSI